jgi:hypothetical protein
MGKNHATEQNEQREMGPKAGGGTMIEDGDHDGDEEDDEGREMTQGSVPKDGGDCGDAEGEVDVLGVEDRVDVLLRAHDGVIPAD